MPLAVRVREARVAAAYRWRVEADVVRCRTGLTSKDEVSGLAGNANEENLAMACRARQHFETTGQKLYELIRRPADLPLASTAGSSG